jgi:LAO/AO transport system kinase
MQPIEDRNKISTPLVRNAISGDRRALAQLLTQIENGTPEGFAALNELYPRSGKAHLVGITGSPGSGKSSLVSQLVHHYRHLPTGEAPRRIAVVAVDPTSPFSGGAVLGDRVRMRDLAGDQGVFIRSMASRGSQGGLAQTTGQMVQVLDAVGYAMIMIETVGAGQSEVEVARLAHTTVVVDAPGMGDDIQAIKAGLLEIADILVINKADRPGVEAAEHALRSMLQIQYEAASKIQEFPCDEVPIITSETKTWIPPLMCTVAIQGKGIEKLAAAIDAHNEFLHHKGNWQNREEARLRAEMEILVRDALQARWRGSLADGEFERMIKAVASRKLSPQQAVEELISNYKVRNS